MPEYIKRDDALHELEKINPVDYGAMWNYDAHHHVGECLRDCKEALDDIPAAAVAPVVRCKDCRYLVNAVVNSNGFLICSVSDMETAPDDFCSHSERRKGGGAMKT